MRCGGLRCGGDGDDFFVGIAVGGLLRGSCGCGCGSCLEGEAFCEALGLGEGWLGRLGLGVCVVAIRSCCGGAVCLSRLREAINDAIAVDAACSRTLIPHAIQRAQSSTDFDGAHASGTVVCVGVPTDG